MLNNKLSIDTKFANLVNELENNECKIISTLLEIKNSSKSFALTKINIISKCGHSNTVQISNFINKHTGIYCKKCIYTKSKNKVVKTNYIKNELIGINKVKELLSNNYICKSTGECCCCNLIIKKKTDNLSKCKKWIGVQVRTTNKKCHNLYSFSLVRIKLNMLIICYCIDENKIWVPDYNEIKHLPKILNIGQKSKYNKYLTNNLLNTINNLYDNHYKFNKEELLTPITSECKKELKYSFIRKEKLSFINFIDPEYKYLSYDFKIGIYKIQEKVSFIINKNKKQYTVVSLHKRYGKNINNKKKQILYQKGDNDFYWFHIADTSIFYIIPEKIMINNGYVTNTPTEIKNIKILNFNSSKNKWLNEYKYDYNNINKSNILNLFNNDKYLKN